MSSGYVQVENGRLYYEAAGEGPPLVMIHAGFLDSRMWDDQFLLYSKNFRAIRYDVRGFGKSDVPPTKYSDYRDLHSLLSHLNVAKTFLLGCSNGGRIALDFAVEFPDMVEALVLVAPGVSGGKASGPEEERLWEEFERKMKPQEDAIRENRVADAAEMDVNAWASAQTPASRQRLLEIAKDNFHVLVENPWKLQASPDPRAFQRLGEIRAPTLFIVGDHDVAPQILMVDHLHSLIPGSKKVLIRGADHIVNMSKPEEFNRTVLEFLNSQKITITNQHLLGA